jgi:chromosome segregation ATPase
MYRLAVFFAIALAASAQPQSNEPQVLQALLTEIRQLRQDLQATAATIQRMQIVMFRVQTESQLLSRASQRADEARTRCESVQQQRRFLTQEVANLEARQQSPQTADQTLAANITRLKANLEGMSMQEQQCQAREIEASAQLRDEQAKMTELQDQLDKLDKVLSKQ